MRRHWGILVIFLSAVVLFSACGTHRKSTIVESKIATSSSPAPNKIYEPTYYSYKNGRYTFVKGRYRRVLFRRAYHKKSLRGYCIKADYASSR